MSNDSPIGSAVVAFPDRSARGSHDEVLIRLLAQAATILNSDRNRAHACVQQAAELLRVSMVREGHVPAVFSTPGGLAPWQAKRVVAYIESNMGLRLRVEELAGVAQFSLSHFFRAFRTTFGMSPLAYVKTLRIRRAQVIMMNTREPLSQVGLACGMYDQAHFSRVFREVVGISPSVWRRQLQCESVSTDDMLRQATCEEVSQHSQEGEFRRRPAVRHPVDATPESGA